MEDLEAERWQALVNRDPQASEQFRYAVTTTGVFCRPGCRSRLPLREHVRFFADNHAAAAAGFRPCKRCAPEQAPAAAERALIERALALLATSEPPPSLNELAAQLGLSPSHLQRRFTAVVGLSPKRYVAALRRERTVAALQQAESVSAALHDAGYQSSGRFYAVASSQLGMAPQRARHGGRGEELVYHCLPCPLGWLLVAAASQGICAVDLGDDAATLVAELQARFPAATLVAKPEHPVATWAAAIIASLDDPGQQLDLPLAVRGTAFQQRVWEELRRIPLGSTVSYQELATRLGNPQGVRAVAQACAANQAALVIPCHRVIGSDGNLRGYRWGAARKAALLAREHELAASTAKSTNNL